MQALDSVRDPVQKGKLEGGGECGSFPRKRLLLAQVPGSVFVASWLQYNPASQLPDGTDSKESEQDGEQQEIYPSAQWLVSTGQRAQVPTQRAILR